MRIQHNIMAMNSYRNYSHNTSALSKNLEKLSSGYRINRAGDDAAGLAISEKMRAQITGLSQAQANAKSGINLVQTAEGALTEVHDMLNRMVKLADQSANGTYDDAVDRKNLQKEVAALQTEIDRIAKASNFNGINLLDGSMSKVTAQDVVSPLDVGDLTVADVHEDGVATQVPPELSIDLSALSYAAKDATGSAVTITIDGNNFSTDALATATSAADLATALANKINGTDSTVKEDDGTTAINGVKIGDYAYTATASGTTLKLTLAANQTLNNAKDFDVNTNVSIAVADDAKGSLTGTINAGSLKITAGQAASPATLAKASFEIDEANLAEGNKLTIGDQTFVFTRDGSTTAGDGETLIDLQGVEDGDLKQVAGDQISNKANSSIFTIGHSGTPGTITLKEVTGGAAGVDLTTNAKIAEQIKFAAPGTLSAEDAKKDALTLQIGDTNDAFNKIQVSIQAMDTVSLGVDISKVDIGSQEGASKAVDAIKNAINIVSGVRGDLGATQNRLEHTINNLSVMQENIQDAEATIRDVDVAEEMMAYTKNNILVQSAQAMLAQANQVPQGVLQLLQ